MFAATLFTIVCVAALVAAEFQGHQPLRAVAKVLASTGFLAVAFAGGLHTTPYGRCVFVGLALGALGDVLLLSSDKRFFLAGLVAFLANHVAFCAGFVWLGPDPRFTAIAAAGLTLVAWRIWRWLSPHTGKLTGPVLAYVVVITTMVALSAGVGVQHLLAATLFFTSDLAVARHRFVLSTPMNKAWGLPLYYAGQLLFAWNAA